MKPTAIGLYLSVGIAAVAFASPALAANQCVEAFKSAIFQCVRGHHDTKKSCFVTAVRTFDRCKKGTYEQCVAPCQSTYQGDNLLCIQTFDPAVCDGDPVCESFNRDQRDLCLRASLNKWNLCVMACR
jgi:hypothetical protein